MEARIMQLVLSVLSVVVVAAIGLAAPAASAHPAPEAQNGVAAFNLGSGSAVEATPGVSPGRVGSETPLFDDGVVVSLVTPSASGGGTTRVYRVEGPGNARLDISPSGNVTAKGDNMLHLNFGDEARAQQFLAQRVSQGHADDVIKSFDVPTSLLDDVRAASVPQRLGRSHPNAPQLVDPTKAADQYGLPACWIGRLNQAIVPGSGSTSC